MHFIYSDFKIRLEKDLEDFTNDKDANLFHFARWSNKVQPKSAINEINRQLLGPSAKQVPKELVTFVNKTIFTSIINSLMNQGFTSTKLRHLSSKIDAFASTYYI